MLKVVFFLILSILLTSCVGERGSLNPQKKQTVSKPQKVKKKKYVSPYEVVAQTGKKQNRIHSIFFVDNDKFLIVANFSQYTILDMTSGKFVHTEDVQGELSRMVESKDKSFVVFYVRNGSRYELYYKPTKDYQSLLKGAVNIGSIANIKAPAIAISPNGRYLFLGGKHQKPSALVDLKTKKLVWKRVLELQYHISSFKDRHVMFSEDGKLIYVYSDQYFSNKKPYQETLVLETLTGKKVRSYYGEKNYKKLFNISNKKGYDKGYGISAHKKSLTYTQNGKQKWKVETGCVGTNVIVDSNKRKGFFTCYDGTMDIRSMEDGSLINRVYTTLGEKENIYKVDDRHLFVQTVKNHLDELVLWDMDSLKIVDSIVGKAPKIFNNGKSVIYKNLSKKYDPYDDYFIYDMATKKNYTFPHNSTPLAFSDKGKYIFGYELQRKKGRKDIAKGKVFLFDTEKLAVVKEFYLDIFKGNTRFNSYQFEHHRVSKDGRYVFIDNGDKLKNFVIDTKKQKVIYKTANTKDKFAGFDETKGKLYLSRGGNIQRLDIATKKIDGNIPLGKSGWLDKKIQFIEGEGKFWLCTKNNSNIVGIHLYNSNTLSYMKTLYSTLYLHNLFYTHDRKHFYTRNGWTFQLRDAKTGDIVKQINTNGFGIDEKATWLWPYCDYCSRVAFFNGVDTVLDKDYIYRKSGKVATYAGNKDRWLVYTPDGYFSSSLNGGELIAVKKGLQGFGIDQIALRNNRPDIILERLGSEDKDRIEFYKKRYEYRLKKAGINEEDAYSIPPTVKITSLTQNGDMALLNFKALSSEGDLKSYTVFVNDTPVLTGELNGKEFSKTVDFTLADKKNKIEISVFNTGGLESVRDLKIAYLTTQKKGDLYYIGFGVSQYEDSSLNLGFAHQDALDLQKVFAKQKKGYKRVITKTLTNEEVTPQAIEEVKKILVNSNPEDTVVLFIAGHGVHGEDGTYYYLTHNAKPNNLKATAASFEMIEDLLRATKSRKKLFLMDTCESGEQEEYVEQRIYQAANTRGIKARTTRGLKKKMQNDQIQKQRPRPWLLERDRFLFADLIRRTGAIVFSSSRGAEFSYESSNIQNGYFTEAIVEALTTRKADKNKNKVVSKEELRDYVSKKVSKDTNKMQNPTIDRDNLEADLSFAI